MYDVVIVGARCGGSPLATLLARNGAKALLVDRARFPSDIPHGHFIHRHGPRRLKAWGLLDRIAAVAPPITEQLIDSGDFPLVARDLAVEGVALGYGPRRARLDKVLVDAAVESGAEVRAEFNVDEFLFGGNRVAGTLGISDALRDADLLAAAIAEGLNGRRPFQDALADYERQRNAESAREFRQNLSAARFEPVPAEFLRIRQAVRSDPAQATRLAMARVGMIDPQTFFNPANLQQLLGATG